MFNPIEDYILKNGSSTNPAIVQTLLPDGCEDPDVPSQVKSFTLSENGEHVLTPDSGYTLSQANVSVEVPMPNVQMKQLTITKNGAYPIMPDAGFDLMDFVGLTVNVPIPEYETWEGGAY